MPETVWSQVASYHRLRRICSLFAMEQYFPKLDVAGSNPVSRSMNSITYVNRIGMLNSEMECSGVENRVSLVCK